MLYVFLCRQSFKVDNMLEKVESDSSKTDVGDPLWVKKRENTT